MALAGEIGLAGTKSGQEIEDFIEAAFYRNLTGLVMRASFSNVPGYNEYSHRYPSRDMGHVAPFPVVEIGKAERDELIDKLEAGVVLVVTLSQGDANPWLEMTQSSAMYVLMAVTILCSVGIIGFALFKWWKFLKEVGYAMSVSQFAFLIEIIANLLRLVYCVDPVYIFTIYSVELQNVFLSASLPFALITTTLIAIYWHELLTQQAMCPKVFPKSYKTVFIAVSVLFLLLTIGAAFLRIFSGLGFAMTIATAGAALVVNLAVTIYFIVIGKAIYQQVKGTPLQRTTTIILLSALCHLALCIVLIITAIPQVFWTPWVPISLYSSYSLNLGGCSHVVFRILFA